MSTAKPLGVDPFDKVRDGLNNILYHDKSNVGLEQQVAEITKNHMQHNLALTILNSQFRLLQTAVSERA
jgi:flagellar basal-body rod protein FlgB